MTGISKLGGPKAPEDEENVVEQPQASTSKASAAATNGSGGGNENPADDYEDETENLGDASKDDSEHEGEKAGKSTAAASKKSRKTIAKADKAMIRKQGQELINYYDKTAAQFYGKVRAAHTDDLAKAGELIHGISEMRDTIVNCIAHAGVNGEKTESLQVRFARAEGVALQACQQLDPRIKVVEHMYDGPPDTSDEEAESRRVEEEEEAQLQAALEAVRIMEANNQEKGKDSSRHKVKSRPRSQQHNRLLKRNSRP